MEGRASIARAFRAAMRFWRFHPLLGGAVVTTAAVGLAANAVLASLVAQVLFPPLPFSAPDRLIHLELRSQAFLRLAVTDTMRIATLTDTVSSSKQLSSVAFLRTDEQMMYAAEGSSFWSSVQPLIVSTEFFDVLGIGPHLGRSFGPDDARAKPRPTILSYGLWRERFGGDVGALGRTIDLPGSRTRGPYVIVGVMPPRFSFPDDTNVWIAGSRPQSLVGVEAVARLSPGASPESTRVEVPELAIETIEEFVRPANRRATLFLALASVGVFLISSLQVASLIAVRLMRRRPELAIRIGLGASPRDVRALCLAEVVLIAIASVLLAAAVSPAFKYIVALVLPHAGAGSVDGALNKAGVETLVFLGVLNLAFASAVPLSLFRGSNASETLLTKLDRRRHAAFRKGVFSLQLAIATALVYLTCGVALGYYRLSITEVGFRPQSLWVVSLPGFQDVPGADGSRPADRIEHQGRLADFLEQLSRHEEVTAIATTSFRPFDSRGVVPTMVRGATDDESAWIDAHAMAISIGFPRAAGLRLLEGNEITAAETSTISLSARAEGSDYGLINETLARRLRRFGAAVGQTVIVAPGRHVEVVGVIEDARFGRIDESPLPTVLTYMRNRESGQHLLVRTVRENDRMIRWMRQRYGEFWRSLPPPTIRSARALVVEQQTDYRSRTALLGAMAAFCVLIAAVGMFGAAANIIAERRQEFAIRVAVGATPNRLRGLVVRYFGFISLLGLALGLGIGIAGAQVAAAMLFGISAFEPALMAAVMIAMALVVLGSVLAPSLGAASLGSTNWLRNDVTRRGSF